MDVPPGEQRETNVGWEALKKQRNCVSAMLCGTMYHVTTKPLRNAELESNLGREGSDTWILLFVATILISVVFVF